MAAYIGKTISLMDTQSVRYIGVLAGISAETSTVILNNVTVFGTEGRRGGTNEVPANTTPQPVLEFKGKDVEDLQVLDEPAQPSQQTHATEQASQPAEKAGGDDDEDFIARTQRLAEEVSVPSDDVEVAYNKKSSFFDNLSSQGPRRPDYFSQERNLNMETFGEAGARPQNGPRGHRPRRGGRGGRGGRRGGSQEGGGQASQSTEWHVTGEDRRGHRGGSGGRGGRGRGGRGRGEGKQGGGYASFQPSTSGQSGGFFS